MTTESDPALMAKTASGDLVAFEQLVLRHQEKAWAFAWRFLQDAAEAEDVVQEAFLRVFRAASQYEPTATFRTYLFTVILRRCLDLRSKKRPEYASDLPPLTDHSASPEKLLLEQERMAAVSRALMKLAPSQRAVLLLRHYEEMSYREIAEVLHISEKAVDSLLQRARQGLRDLLTHEDPTIGRRI